MPGGGGSVPTAAAFTAPPACPPGDPQAVAVPVPVPVVRTAFGSASASVSVVRLAC